MSINKIKDFFFQKYHKKIGFSKERSWYAMILDPCNAKEHYLSFIIKKNRKSVKQSEIMSYPPPKKFEIPNIVDIKSFITKHSKTLHILSKTIK